MSTVATPPPITLVEKVKQFGLTAVAIVDDAYDPPTSAEPSAEDQTQIWTAIQNDAASREQFAALPNAVEEPDQLTFTWLMGMLAAEQPDSTIRRMIEDSDFGKRIHGRRPDMDVIEKALKEELSLEVRTFGSEPDLDGLLGVQVVFLDWYLGEDLNEESIDAAISQAKRIYDHFPRDAKPIMVLFSWFPDVVSRTAEFREKSGLISGIFHCVEKSELRQPELRGLHILTLAESIEVGRAVQRFTESVVSSSLDSLKEFESAIKSLSLSDYSTIQVLSLQDDGHPLGDYMCWLFSGLLADILFGKNLAAERQALNGSDFQSVNIPIDKPSQALAQIYHSAVFDMGVGGVANHPDVARKSPTASLTHPDLGLGDLFIVENRTLDAVPMPLAKAEAKLGLFDYFLVVLKWLGLKSEPTPLIETNPDSISGVRALDPTPNTASKLEADVYLLLNPACDLAQSPYPGSGEKPRLAKASSLVLIPGIVGTLPAPATKLPEGIHRTPLFVYPKFNEGKGVYIDWMLKSVLTVPFAGFEEWAAGDDTRSIVRVARMRSLNALEIQHHFASEMSRVGVPIPPTYYLDARVTLQFVEQKSVVHEETASGQVRLVLLKGLASKSHARFSPELLLQVMSAMTARRDTAGDRTKPTRNELEKAIANQVEWAKLRQPCELSGAKDISIFNSIVVLIPSGEGSLPITNEKTILRIVFDAKEIAEE